MKPIPWIVALATLVLLSVLWLRTPQKVNRPEGVEGSAGERAGASISPHATTTAPTAASGAIALTTITPPEVLLEQDMAKRLLALIEAESDPVLREQAAETGAKKIPRALLGSVLGWLQKNSGEPGVDVAMRGVMLRWAWEEPTGAAAWTLEAAAGEFRRDALGMIAAGWARLQPAALQQWAGQLAPAERDWVLMHGASYLARTDLDKFDSWQTTLAPSRERDRLLADAARLWASRDPLKLMELINRGGTDANADWRRHLAHGLAGHLADATDPSVVASVVGGLPAGEAKNTVLSGLVTGWSTREPELVATWLEGVQDTSLRAELSALLAGNWLHKDTEAALAWMRTLPPNSPIAEAVAKRAAEFAAVPDSE